MTIRGMIQASGEFNLAPSTIDFGLLSESDVRSRTIRISRNNREAVSLLSAASNSPALEIVEQKEDAKPPGGSDVDGLAECEGA